MPRDLRTTRGVLDPEQVEWLTLGQAADYLGVSESRLRRWTDEERLPVFKTPGKHRRFRRADLDAFIGRPEARKGPPRILVVDDDEGVRELVRESLEREGYSVRAAASAEEGLAALEQERPDVVLLDVMMPRMNGWEMLQRVQERHGTGTIPVIMFSGKVDPATSPAEGVHGFIGKPFDPEQLVDATKQLVPI